MPPKLILSKREADAKDFLKERLLKVILRAMMQFGIPYFEFTNINLPFYVAHFMKKKLPDYNFYLYKANIRNLEDWRTSVIPNHRWIYAVHPENTKRKLIIDIHDGKGDFDDSYIRPIFMLVEENELPATSQEYKNVYRLSEPVLLDMDDEAQKYEKLMKMTCAEFINCIEDEFKK